MQEINLIESPHIRSSGYHVEAPSVAHQTVYSPYDACGQRSEVGKNHMPGVER